MAKRKKLAVTDFNILYDNILVKGVEVTERDGVVIPDSFEDKPELGEVVAIGEGRIFDNGNIVPLKVKIGDTVYFNKYSSVMFNIEGEHYYVVREEDVIGLVRGN